MTKAGEKLLAAAREALAFARGEDTGARVWDGRMFGWQRVRSGRTQVTPVIIWDRLHGGSKNFDFVGGLHLMKPHEYGHTLDVLAAIYPAPDVPEE